MKRILLILAVLFMFAQSGYSEEPIIDVPDVPPDKEVLDEFEENYLLHELMRYYKMAFLLEHQLSIYGAKPRIPLQTPSFEMVESPEPEMVMEYYFIARSYQKQVEAVPDGTETATMKRLKDKLIKQNEEFLKQRSMLAELELYKQESNFYRQSYDELVDENTRLRMKLDTAYLNYNRRYMDERAQLSEAYENYCHSCITIFSAGATANNFFSPADELDTKFSYGVVLTMNASPILGIGKYFDIWFEYIAPRYTTKTLSQNSEVVIQSEEWKSDLFKAGVDANIPDIIRIEDFYAGLKIGLGHFWSNGRIYNSAVSGNDWEGNILKLELNIAKSGECYPLELYFAYNAYFYTTDFAFNRPTFSMNFGKETLNSIVFGLRFPIWKEAVISKNMQEDK